METNTTKQINRTESILEQTPPREAKLIAQRQTIMYMTKLEILPRVIFSATSSSTQNCNGSSHFLYVYVKNIKVMDQVIFCTYMIRQSKMKQTLYQIQTVTNQRGLQLTGSVMLRCS